MVVVVCIQKCNGKPALVFYRMETGRIEPSRRKCAIHRRQWYPFFHTKMRQCVENIHDVFQILSISSNSSSPVAVAYEHWGVWKRYNHRTARLLPHCIPLYLRGQRDAVCIWQFSSFFVRRLLVRHHLQWRCFLQMTTYLNNGHRSDCCSSRQRSKIVGHHVTRHNLE